MLNFRDDASTFKAFIKEHQDKVFNLVLKMVQDISDAEEITQDVFVDVYRRSDAFRGKSSITTWLFRIAMNKSIDHLRKKKRRSLFSSYRDQGEPADFLHPGVKAEDREKAIILFRAMKKLPESQNLAWVLCEMENMSYKEISEIMKLSQSAVESLLFRARQNLKKILSGIYDKL